MKAWQCSTLGVPWQTLELIDVEPPALEPDTVRIRVEATDLNFADILQCEGRYQVRLEPPFTPGMTAAGVVIEAAAGSGFVPGQRLIGPTQDGAGGYAEEALLNATLAHPLPEGIDPVVAAAMHITYPTAWFALYLRGDLQPGETVLVLAAAGGVGSAAVELARQRGAYVIAAAGGADKAAVCRALGADAVIDYSSEDLYESVMALTDGRGVDVVYDPVGGRYFDVARRLVAWEGRLLVIGFASGDIPQAPANHVLVKNYSVVGVHMGGYRQRDRTPFGPCYEEVYGLLAAGRISPVIDSVIGFEALPAALKRLAERGTTGRVVLDAGRG
jgi:NADPH2:quinone reductase